MSDSSSYCSSDSSTDSQSLLYILPTNLTFCSNSFSTLLTIEIGVEIRHSVNYFDTIMRPNSYYCIKGTVRSQIFLKYIMLRTVTKNSTIIITKYTWYHRYREIIQSTGGPSHYGCTGCQTRRQEGEKSNTLTSPQPG